MKKKLIFDDTTSTARYTKHFFLFSRGSVLIIFLLLFSFHGQASNYKFILWESFEEIPTPALPNGWTIANLNGDDKQWETIKYGGIPERHQCARYNGNPTLPASDWLFTPATSLDASTLYTLSFLCKVSPVSVQRMKIFIGNTPDPLGMVTQLFDNSNITNTTLQTNSIDFSVATSGTYYIGFYCYSGPGQKQFFLDDIMVSCLSSDLNLTVALVKKLLNPAETPAYLVNDTIECYVILENATSGILVLNTSFNVGSISDPEYELSYIIIPPNGDTLHYVILSEPEPFSTSRKFEMVEPGNVKGRFEDLQQSFIFSQTGTYTVRAVYRSYQKSQSYDVWLGKLISDPVTFTIQ
jgi:hypothetical protein